MNLNRLGKSAIFVLMLLSLFFVAACGNDTSSQPSQPADQQNKEQKNETASKNSSEDPIVIGLLQEETGRFSWYGEEVVMTAKLWGEEVNKSGGINGREVKLITYDTQSSPEQALTGFDKLVKLDKVDLIVGPSLVGNALAVDEKVKDNGPLMYSTSGGYEPRNKFTFAGVIYRKDSLVAVANWYKEIGVKRVGYIGTNDETGQQGLVEFKEVLDGYGIEVIASEFMNVDDVDVTGQIRKILNEKPDAIESLMTGKPAAIALQAIHQLGVEIPVTIGHGNVTEQFLESIKNVTPKMLTVPSTKDIGYDGLDPNDAQYPLIKELNDKFHAKYNKNPGLAAGAAWDILNILKEAIEKTGGTDSVALVEYIEGIDNYVGTQATYDFSDEDHRGIGPDDGIIVRVADNKFVFLESEKK